jgi:hypothetical protein
LTREVEVSMSDEKGVGDGEGTGDAVLKKEVPKARTNFAQEMVDNLNRYSVAQAVVNEMATRQGMGPGGPELKWSEVTDGFRTRFLAAYAEVRSTEPFDAGAFVQGFVDAWPEGEGVLRMDPSWKGVLAQPPYTEKGLWPAFLRRK